MKITWMVMLALLVSAMVMIPQNSIAAGVEISGGFSFNQTTYSENSFSWTRRWGGTFGVNLTDATQIELSFQDVTDRTYIVNFEDTVFKDKIYSVNWVQQILGKGHPIQPYFKVGFGQLNREASGNYAFGGSPPALVDSLTAILGAGFKIYLTRSMGLRAELSSYLTGGSIRTWKDNTGITFGVSFLF